MKNTINNIHLTVDELELKDNSIIIIRIDESKNFFSENKAAITSTVNQLLDSINAKSGKRYHSLVTSRELDIKMMSIDELRNLRNSIDNLLDSKINNGVDNDCNTKIYD